METVVVSVDGSAASRAGVEWCARHVEHTTRVIAVGSLGSLGEFVNDVVAFDSASAGQIRETFQTKWCAPLQSAGLDWRPVFAHHTQPVALADVIEDEHPDLVVIGRPKHAGLDLLLGGQLGHALHHAECPVLLVPAADGWHESEPRSMEESRSAQA